ncbi:MAG: choice-of-anchor D domain-containing protein [Luteolibacter sp.]|uniref:choice-of-anchor D domain-containing protein n=1 Tax=Luteolibacter sp. TaxID=1962973 RepID=UPI003263DBF7
MFREDHNQTSVGNAARNLGALRRIVLNALKLGPSGSKKSLLMKRLNALVNPAYREKAPFPSFITVGGSREFGPCKTANIGEQDRTRIMKLLPLASALVLASLSSAFAVTDADIDPAALVGKTLTFTIVTSSAPLATTGTWSGTFAASGNGFTAAKITGDFVDISTTYAVTAHFVGETDCTFDRLVSGVEEKAYVGLYSQNGIGKFDIGLGAGIMEGTFTIGGGDPPKGPEISIVQGHGAALTDGSASKKNIGTALVGKSVSKTFTIKNTGTATLKNISISVDGKNKTEFTVSKLGGTSVAQKSDTSFVVTFKAKSIGVKNAAIHIKSNDKDENPFDIKLTGTGAGIK